MTNPYVECAPAWTRSHGEDDVYWIVTEDEDGESTASAMFYDLEDAREYVRLVLNVPKNEIKVVKEEE